VSRVFQMSEVQLRKRQPEWVREVQEESTVIFDEAAPLGTLSNPVGPDPQRPKNIRVWHSSRKYYKCQRYGHTRSGAMQCGWPDSLESSGI
jgi:hypothetical protein